MSTLIKSIIINYCIGSENIINESQHRNPGNRINISKLLQKNNIKTSQNDQMINSKDKECNEFLENSQEKIETNEEKTVVIENL